MHIARARLQMQLVAWINDTGNEELCASEDLVRVLEDPELQEQVQAAIRSAAVTLGFASPEQVVKLLEEMASEFAFIEALRDRLLRPVKTVAMTLERARQTCRPDPGQMATLNQVKQLLAVALLKIGTRFSEVDAQTGEILAALRNIENQLAFIRKNRDWFCRSQLAWAPLLAEWEFPPRIMDDSMWALLHRTCHFLALRFMPFTEWQQYNQPAVKAEPKQLVW